MNSVNERFNNHSAPHGFPYVPEPISPWFNSVERFLILDQVAESWRGTPFMPNAAIKGHGVSCQKLVTEIYKECGHLSAEFQCDEGPMCWSRSQKESLIEKFMAGLPQFMSSNFPTQTKHPRTGDMLGFKIDGCIHHCGVMLGDGRFIHCWRNGGVMFSHIHDATYSRRLVKLWRPIQLIP